MSLKRILLLCSLFVLSLSGCQKDSEDAPSATTRLTASPWHITSYTRATGSGAATDYIPTLFPRSCERDDRYTFKSTGSEERTEGPTACSSSSNSQTVVGTYPWNFNSSQTQLTIGATTFDVVQLTADVMQLRSSRTSGGVTITDNVSYAN